MKKHFLRLLAAVVALLLLVPVLGVAEDEAKLAEGADIRVMSFNLLHPDWGKSPVNGRLPNVVSILEYYMPDVVGIQEVDAKWHRALIPALIDTGVYAPACRQSNAAGFQFNLTTFLYNPKTVKLVDEYVLDLDKNSNIRVLAVGVFEKLSDGTRFVVTNTHPNSSHEVEIYTQNCTDMMTLASEELKKYQGLPFIMTGDFNTEEADEMYQTIMTALGVKDAKYEADVMVRNLATYIGWGGEEMDPARDYCIDHIFVNDKADVKLFNVVVDHNIEATSDHRPVYADIDLK